MFNVRKMDTDEKFDQDHSTLAFKFRPGSNCSRSRGVTKAQLVIAVTIVVGVFLILALVIRATLRSARGASCEGNMHQISEALQQYAQDNDGVFPASVISTPINGGTDQDVPYDRQLATYISDDTVYACPQDNVPRGHVAVFDGKYIGHTLNRSYAITDQITTTRSAKDLNTGIVGRPTKEIEQPARTVMLVEIWGKFGTATDSVVGGHGGSTLAGCDTWKLPGRNRGSRDPIDYFAPCQEYSETALAPATGHQSMGNYAFADGHVKALSWRAARVDDFAIFKIRK